MLSFCQTGAGKAYLKDTQTGWNAHLPARSRAEHHQANIDAMQRIPKEEMAVRLFVPGRICLFGEHSDWAGGHRRSNPGLEKGYTLICGTDQGIHADARSNPATLRLTSTAPDGTARGPHEIPMVLERLMAEAQGGGFWSYAAGVAFQVASLLPVGGLTINNFKTDLPIRKGLSSSAAICVLVARAFNRIYHLGLTIRDEMELAYQGEITTPSRCGRMDQGCANGRRPVLMTFDGDQLDIDRVRVGEDVYLVLVDLNAKKDTQKILSNLNRCYPFAGNDVQRDVQQLLGPVNRRIVGEAVGALEAGDAEQLGALMRQAQAFFDLLAVPACSGELAAPVLHRVLDYEPLRPHIWGGKGVGSQGDGTAQFVARSREDQRAVVEIIQRDLAMPCLQLTVPRT
jgi:galactokinase